MAFSSGPPLGPSRRRWFLRPGGRVLHLTWRAPGARVRCAFAAELSATAGITSIDSSGITAENRIRRRRLRATGRLGLISRHRDVGSAAAIATGLSGTDRRRLRRQLMRRKLRAAGRLGLISREPDVGSATAIVTGLSGTDRRRLRRQLMRRRLRAAGRLGLISREPDVGSATAIVTGLSGTDRRRLRRE